jgi:H+/Cl- antiporter ClcA
VNWALPATVGNGNISNDWVIKYGAMHYQHPEIIADGISEHLLICTGFARMALLGVSMNCGFVGGIVFPFLSMGIITGAVASRHYPDVPVGLFISSFMVALPSGIVPMPFTFTCLSAFAYFLGLNQTVPVFVACVTSFGLVCSTGLMKGLVLRSAAREAAEAAGAAGGGAGAAGDAAGEAGREKAKKAADEFALNHYLGNQKKAAAAAAAAAEQ